MDRVRFELDQFGRILGKFGKTIQDLKGLNPYLNYPQVHKSPWIEELEVTFLPDGQAVRVKISFKLYWLDAKKGEDYAFFDTGISI